MSFDASKSHMQLNAAATHKSEEHVVKGMHNMTKDADGGPAQDTKAAGKARAKAAEKARAKAAEKAKAARKAKAMDKAAKKAKAMAAKKAKAKAAKKAKAKAAKQANANIEPETTGAPRIKPNCKCQECEKCHPDSGRDWNTGV
jgi:hypothetical protein